VNQLQHIDDQEGKSGNLHVKGNSSFDNLKEKKKKKSIGLPTASNQMREKAPTSPKKDEVL